MTEWWLSFRRFCTSSQLFQLYTFFRTNLKVKMAYLPGWLWSASLRNENSESSWTNTGEGSVQWPLVLLNGWLPSRLSWVTWAHVVESRSRFRLPLLHLPWGTWNLSSEQRSQLSFNGQRLRDSWKCLTNLPHPKAEKGVPSLEHCLPWLLL